MEDRAAQRELKGKGKDAEPNSGGTSAAPDAAKGKASGASMPRMAQSAASFLLSGPPGAGLSGGNEKGESSRTGEALARAGESSVQLRSAIPGNETMRRGQAQEHIAQEEASFAAFLDNSSAPMLSEPRGLESAWQSAVPGRTVSSVTGHMGPPPQSTADQEAKDGADVVALLSSDGGLDQVFDHTNEPPSQHDLASLRKALFGEETDQAASPIAWDNVLNFVPEYLRAPTGPGIKPEDDFSLHLGTTDTNEAWQTWIGQWSRVLTSYQDEVWGDLSVLIDEARTEIQRIEEAKPGEKPPEPTALLRLQAILGHLRGAD